MTEQSRCRIHGDINVHALCMSVKFALYVTAAISCIEECEMHLYNVLQLASLSPFFSSTTKFGGNIEEQSLT